MRLRKSMLVLVVASAALAAGSERAFEELVAEAVGSYQDPWMPTDRPLTGLVVGVDAAGGGAAGADQRRTDDLNLLTAEHLYHLVRRAGGTVVMTRTGDYRLGDGEEDATARAKLLRDARCEVCVSIRHTPDEKAGAAAVSGSEELAGHLQAASKEKMTAAVVVAAGETPYACEVRFGTADDGGQPARDSWAMYQGNARMLYDGIVRYAADAAADTQPTAEPPAVGHREARRLARAIWPEGDLPAARVNWFCKQFAARGPSALSLTYFKPTAEVEETTVVLSGATNMPTLVSGLTDALRTVGITDVRDEIRVLPDEKTLGEKRYGVCRVPMALTYTGPDSRVGRGKQTQLLYGEPVFLLDRVDDQLLLHGSDGYWGWVESAAIRTMSKVDFDAYVGREQAVVLEDVETPEVRIPRGSRLPLTNEGSESSTVLLADGGQLELASSVLSVPDPRQCAQQSVRRALSMMHTPYVFGGRSPLGLDCSGLVGNVSVQGGGAPARDAWQLALSGTLVATPWHREGMRAGDLIYFINPVGRIYHVAIAVDGTHFVQSRPPEVGIGTLDPKGRLFDELDGRDFFMVKRP